MVETMRTDILLLKNTGNTNLKNGKFLDAIICYDEALRRARRKVDAAILMMNRCYARLLSDHFDAAIADAIAVIDFSIDKPPEKAPFRAGCALYCLGRWEEALKYFESCYSLYPTNKDVCDMIGHCKDRMHEATTGEYDFKTMLDEVVAKHPEPRIDHADYVGPVEVRDCEDKSHGRGLFTTKAVQAGELLLCERAFDVAFVDTSQPTDTLKQQKEEDASLPIDTSKQQTEEDATNEMLWASLDRRNELEECTLIKLLRNPSLQAAFADLYPGPDWVDERDETTGLPVVEENFVQKRIMYNNFGFPPRTYEYHWGIGHHPELVPDDIAGSRGIWIKASYINHSCYPTVRRSFIGDIMIFRAQQNVPANTELKIGYISGLEEVDVRQKKLKVYGFDCDCRVCEAEKNTSGKKMKKRYGILRKIIDIFEKGNVNRLETYTDLLDALESTYENPPKKEYRRAMITPVTNLITGCLQSDLPHQVIELTHRLLVALGFELKITNTTFQILEWGFLIDELVISLVDLRDAYKIVNPALVRDVEATAKKAYLIMCGEDVTYEQAYGPGGRRDKLQQGGKGAEDLSQGVQGMELD